MLHMKSERAVITIFGNYLTNHSKALFMLKCICNENLILALPKNFIFSDNFHTNLVEKFELEVCEFLLELKRES